MEARIADARFKAADPQAEAPLVIGGYRLGRVLDSEAAFHVTYEAKPLTGSAPVSLKVFSVSVTRRDERRFERAGRSRGDLEHPHLLKVGREVTDDEWLFVATDLCNRPTLADALRRGSLEPEDTIRLLSGAAGALDAAAAVGVIDRELSPETIFIDGDGGALLGDLGIGMLLHPEVPPWARPNPHYLSPEQARREALVTESNVYSLGCVLFECLTGSPPFDGDQASIVYRHAAQEPPPVSTRRPDVGSAIDAVLAKALAKESDRRFSSAARMVNAAARALIPGAEVLPPRSRGNGASPNGALAPPVPRPRVPIRRPRPKAPDLARQRERIKPFLTGLLVLPVAVAIAAAAYLIGDSGGAAPASPGVEARAGAISIDLPGGWERKPDGVTLPGLRSPGALVAGPAGQSEPGLLAWQVRSTGADLLPPGLTPAGAAEPLRLGGLQAVRRRAAFPGGQAVTYTVPNTKGAAVVACPARTGGSPLPACTRAAGSLLLSVEQVPISSVSTALRRLDGTVARLDRARAAGRLALADAHTPAGQARAARSLQRAYAAAAGSPAATAGGFTPAYDPAALRRVFTRAKAQYARIERAAEASAPGQFGAAARGVRAAEADVARALAPTR